LVPGFKGLARSRRCRWGSITQTAPRPGSYVRLNVVSPTLATLHVAEPLNREG